MSKGFLLLWAGFPPSAASVEPGTNELFFVAPLFYLIYKSCLCFSRPSVFQTASRGLMPVMTEACFDPLHFLVDRLCCRVYLDGGGNVRLGFSSRHGLTDMMTAQGIARSNALVLREQLRSDPPGPNASSESEGGAALARDVARGAFCPIA